MDIYFPLYDVGGVDLETAITFASGDVMISKDGGTFANTTNLPTEIATTSGVYKLTLAGAEYVADVVKVKVVDQTGPKVWMDKVVIFSPGADLANRVMQVGTVNDLTTTPTTTVFAALDITEATASHFVGRVVIWATGNLKYQAAKITAYSLVSGEGKFTVTGMTEAPADGDVFVTI